MSVCKLFSLTGPFSKEHRAARRKLHFDIQSKPCQILYSQCWVKSSYLQTGSFSGANKNHRITYLKVWQKGNIYIKGYNFLTWKPLYAGIWIFCFLSLIDRDDPPEHSSLSLQSTEHMYAISSQRSRLWSASVHHHSRSFLLFTKINHPNACGYSVHTVRSVRCTFSGRDLFRGRIQRRPQASGWL